MHTKTTLYNSENFSNRRGMMTMASFLKTWRLSEDLSQQEFAAQLKISPANLCDIEKGRKGVSPKKAEEIAKIIGYSPKVLIELALKEILRGSGLKFDVVLKEPAKKVS